ncbi:MAG: hypothetical protein IT260_23430 [Saprospiraceae bacterium]|nr:hypothetical protein [Saprospiraceae bacterium]
MAEKSSPSALAEYVLSEIRRHLPANMELAKTIEPLLGLSSSSLYKRLRGEAAFTADELLLLARSFAVSLDHFVLKNKGIVRVDFPAMTTPLRAAPEFLQQIKQHLLLATLLPQARLWYATSEVPLFHYFKFPELAAFKLHMWSRTTWQLDSIRPTQFCWADNPDAAQIEEQCAYLFKLYTQLESYEFWPSYLLENTLSQIDYLAYQGGFADPQAPRRLYTYLNDLLLWQREMAACGRKLDTNGQKMAGFTLYHNEIAHTNNTFLLQTPDFRQAFFTFDNPNFGASIDPEFCAYTQDWFNKLQHCSTRISLEGDKQRARFFDGLHHRLAQNAPAA